MKKYRVYGVHVASNKAWDESVYDEVIRANSPRMPSGRQFNGI